MSSPAGVALILISSELPELLGMSDRVLVMRGGHQMGVFAGSELQQERIMTAAVGGHERAQRAKG